MECLLYVVMGSLPEIYFVLFYSFFFYEVKQENLEANDTTMS